jgi:hypothetical protein
MFRHHIDQSPKEIDRIVETPLLRQGLSQEMEGARMVGPADESLPAEFFGFA